MARKKEFDEGDALRAAMEAFWNAGYDGTSVPDLLAATGLSRSSLYETFGDKRSLFLKTVDLYVREADHRRRSVLDDAPSLRSGLESYFGARIAACADSSRPQGCYLTSISATLRTADDEVRTIVEEASREAERYIEALFRKAIESGEFSGKTSAAEWTSFFMCFSWGLNVASRIGRSEESLRAMVRGFLSCVEAA